MPTTLTYGMKKPIAGEQGDTVFSALEDNITRADSHSHNGTDSAQLDPKNFAKTVTTLASASWVAVSGQTGTYKQTLTVPTGYTVDGAIMKFYVGSGSEAGNLIYPSVKKLSSTTADVYINDNTIDVKVTYG